MILVGPIQVIIFYDFTQPACRKVELGHGSLHALINIHALTTFQFSHMNI